MPDLQIRIETAARAMREVAAFLSAPTLQSMEEHQTQLTFVVNELNAIIVEADSLPPQETKTTQAPLGALLREVQMARSLVLQATGIFQSFQESSDSEAGIYSQPVGNERAMR